MTTVLTSSFKTETKLLAMWCNFFLLVATVSGLFQLSFSAEYSRTIYIDSESGHDSNTCISGGNISQSESIPCQSLHWAFLPEHRKNSTQYILLQGRYNLSQSIETFEHLDTIAITGADMNGTIIECTSHKVGLAFVDVHKLTVSNITIWGCSTQQNSTSRAFYKQEFALYEFLVGLFFYHCHDVTMSFVTVSNSPNATGVVMYDTDGIVAISDSIFTNNTVPDIEDKDEKHLPPGGGGFYVEFSYCIPGDETCKNNSKGIVSHESRNEGAQYFFSNCRFSNNSANNLDDIKAGSYIIPYRSDHEAFGRGGGLSIFFKGNASSNVFSISNCHFISNRALWGAGLFVEFHDDTANNTVNVSNSMVADNKCLYSTDAGTGGGGMRIGHYVYAEPWNSTGIGNRIYLDTLTFDSNSALTGGGLSISPALQTVGYQSIGSITVFNSTFTENIARLGAAIEIDRFSFIINGQMINISLEQCHVHENSNDYVKRIPGYKNKPYQVGIGAVYINSVNVVFKGRVIFVRNNGSALAVVGSSVDFSNCYAYFSQNTGNTGAGIALLGSAYIQIDHKTTMFFVNNTATAEGGAIYNKYIERENLKSYSISFIRHVDYFLTPDEWESNFTFFLNRDQRGPNIIHTTSILPFAWAGGSNANLSRIFCWKGWNCIDHIMDNCTLQVRTDVGEISPYQNEYNVKAFPGIAFSLPLQILDDLHHDVSSRTVFFSSINALNGTGISNGSYPSRYISRESTMINGSENQHLTLHLDSLGDRAWHAEMVVELQPCPPGFMISEENVCKCESLNTTHRGALFCDPDSFRSLLKNGHWMGKVLDKKEYFVSQCPPGYCYINPKSSYIILHNGTNLTSSKNLDNLLCGEKNRTNVSCGQCIDGHGPAVNSLTFECVYCNESDSNVSISSNIAKYVASVYIPLFVMFTILILFDIRLTTGPANAFILYCQVVASTFNLDADGQIPLDRITTRSNKLLLGYRIPYGIFNLEFIETFLSPLCLGTNFNNLSVFLLDYAVAVSPLVMILTIVVCVKLKDWITERYLCWKCTVKANTCTAATHKALRNINEALLPAFAAFILLSYTKFCLTSSYLLRYQPLLYSNGNYYSYRAYYAGQFPMTDPEYLLKYFLPAVLFIATFVITPPLLLLQYPLRAFEWTIRKVNCVWKFYPVDKIHFFLDTFQGCYKNKMRFFAGLYFLFRFVVNISYIFTNTWLEQYVIQQLACTIMIVLLAVFRPYNKENKIFNFVDILTFANLAAINALSFYMYSASQNSEHAGPTTLAFIVQYILVFLPLIYMLIYITCVTISKVIQSCTTSTDNSNVGPFQSLSSIIKSSSKAEHDANTDIEHILARAEMENTYKAPNLSKRVERKDIVDKDSKRTSSTRINSGQGYQDYGSTGSLI